MKYELIFKEDMDALHYLQELLQAYPYDIEERMVLSLLEVNPYPHPILLSFIHYFQTIFKLHLVSQQEYACTHLDSLYRTMCRLTNQDSALFHLHQYAFDVTYILTEYELTHPYAHLPLAHIPFVTQVHVHNIPIIQMAPYESIRIQRSTSFIYKNISIDASAFLALCIRIEDKYGIIFISKDCCSFVTALASLYTITTPPSHFDFMLIFALRSEQDQCSYYYDETNELYIGLVRGKQCMQHFLYLKEMILTLYNSICIEKNDLPIHASMINVFKGQQFGIVFCGITGSGKSEMLDAIKHCCPHHQAVYDDNGILHYLDNTIVSTGSETGACKDITYLHKETMFNLFHDSIFLKEEKVLKWQIVPLTTHAATMQFHPVHCLCYLNPNANFKGIRRITHVEDLLTCFLQEDPTSFHCGSLGCYDQKEKVNLFIQEFLTVLFVQNIPIYEVSTKATSYQKQTLFKHIAVELLSLLHITNI